MAIVDASINASICGDKGTPPSGIVRNTVRLNTVIASDFAAATAFSQHYNLLRSPLPLLSFLSPLLL